MNHSTVIDYLTQNGIDQELLEDLVYDRKGNEAAAINNGGLDDQVTYLMDCGLTPDAIITAARGL